MLLLRAGSASSALVFNFFSCACGAKMPVTETQIEGLLLVCWDRFDDQRGFFKQSYQTQELSNALRRPVRLAQGNHSRSRPGVLRGFHTEPWDKLIYVVRGTALCVVADVRPNSETFGLHQAFLLGDSPGFHHRIFVSRGLSNAFYCQTEVDYLNDVSRNFDPVYRNGVAWNDPTLGVDWPNKAPILSSKDASLPKLSELFPNHSLFLET